jgi:DNA-binding MarR family transcriptional regulator
VTDTTRPRRAGFRLSQLGQLASQRFATAVAELGLTPAEAGVLRVLARADGISQRDVADRVGAVPSRIVVLVDSLQDKGLVTRSRSRTDRRHHELRLTTAGAAMLKRLRRVAEEHERSLLEPLSERERDQLTRLLAKIAAGHDLEQEAHPGYRD